MTKNKIIPQMYDVRPVDETGDLDWKKIQATGGLNFEMANDEIEVEESQPQFEKKVNAYILGVPIDSEKAPVLHDPYFDVNDFQGQDAFVNDYSQQYFEQENSQEEYGNYDEIESYQNYLEQQKIERQIALHQEIARRQAAREEMLRKQQERLMLIEQEKIRFREKQEEIEKRKEAEKQNQQQILAERSRMHAQKEEQARLAAIRRQEELKKNAEIEFERRKAIEAEILEQREKYESRQIERKMEEELARIKQTKREKKLAAKKQKIKRSSAFLPNQYSDSFAWKNIFFAPKLAFQANRSPLAAFAIVALIISLGIGTVSYASKGIGLKGKVLGVSQDGYANLNSAVSDMAHQNFEGSSEQFSQAFANFSQASDDLQNMGGILLDATKYIPFVSKISSGKNAVEAGKHFSAAGQSLNEFAKVVSTVKNPIQSNPENQPSLLDVLESAEQNISKAKIELDGAQQNIDSISIDDLPKDKQNQFLLLKQKLPDIRNAMDLFLNNSHILVDLLGGNGPRKYLFLFQNNSEMRATGGFIGTYGLLDISGGRIKKFFIDGIFNPDGQLKDKIVPPTPIQKISANWSLHDSNWFPDFPTSAKKAINFYEKTGGPTADGVITFTPAVMQKLLEITGPIDMPEYGVTLDADNFLELTQYKVESDYDKQENQPKKILSDLAPLVLDKLLSSRDLDTLSKTAQAILSGLQEKHILLYSENSELQKIIQQQGWSGEILPSSKDYLSVINTNINGYKTDAIIDETINHKAEIQTDGSIIDTVTITRKHNGGSSPYEWLNKVNADYMRVYVPQGSKLLEVSGQTREQDNPPLDYDALGFKRDSDVQAEEQKTAIDPESGTKIYDEAGKTVFANWTYVSPQETMTISYKYLLPFSLFNVSVGNGEQVDSYSLVAQKQSGSFGSKFNSEISYPATFNLNWNFPDTFEKNTNNIKNSSDLIKDRFEGLVFIKK